MRYLQQSRFLLSAAGGLLLLALVGSPLTAQLRLPVIFPESQCISARDPAELCRARIPDSGPPHTVRNRQVRTPQPLSLNEAIEIAIANSQVVRVLGGVTAVNSGRTIYDPAIANTRIDEAHAAFDPQVDGRHDFIRNDLPVLQGPPFAVRGDRSDRYQHSTEISKRTVTGGIASLRVDANRNRQRLNPTRLRPGQVNPSTRSSVALSLTQPLLQGGGVAFNLSPIVIARIDTERSFFQLKDGLQSMVIGVIQAYWNLVQSRLDVWALQQQIDQAERTNNRARSRRRAGIVSGADTSQAQQALATLRANLIAAQARLINDEAALRSILGLPPANDQEFVPITPPTNAVSEFDWDELLVLAEEQRPDIIELKLVLEADEQLLLQARNRAQPSVNASAMYRWNGLEGEIPGGVQFDSHDGDTFADWSLGVNFSVPIGLRQGRAGLRRQELVLSRDRANLNQAMLQVVHTLSASVRDLDQLYLQYQAFRETRTAAETNLRILQTEYTNGRIDVINVLAAISSWGNAISSEASTLTRYNVALANLERETGSVLAVHGITLFEERYRSLGPLGRLGECRCYPKSLPPVGQPDRYPAGEAPSEEFFDLNPPNANRPNSLPPPTPMPSPRR